MSHMLELNARTVKARITIDNGDGFLKLRMFEPVSIDADKEAQGDTLIAIPEEAIITEGADRYFSIRIGEGRFNRGNTRQECGNSRRFQ